ncbi:A/G-specific adenine glycosylase [Nocardioides stalactiti]|uniref:A/G-specific adenine glycosylase n=1 Tax=Nocardioides stalactiti TaxID=2755356 RepID=UPI001C80B562|nr:A/G-specific adenine glycosylase [Nocardioides stalactiti]
MPSTAPTPADHPADRADALVGPILAWYDENARDLPWRDPSASAWSVLVSEFMLQQTPVVRVLPVHAVWLERWPTPAALASESSGEAVRAWGRLGYPRRALRLHAAATAIVADHAGVVPDSYDALLALPGIGDYTAAAVASFAYRQRHVVLDTNVRRVLGRAVSGVEFPARSVTRAERDVAAALLPEDPPTAATWSVAVMELGALVCTADRPRCDACPVVSACAWHTAGRPAYDGPPRPVQTYAGTDRQCRGRLLAVLRDSPGSVPKERLDLAWNLPEQRERCLASLVADRLVVRLDPTDTTNDGGPRYALP